MNPELVTGVLTTREITIAGILVGFIIVLLYIIKRLWEANQDQVSYIRENDKENLKILNLVAQNITGVESKLDSGIGKINDNHSLLSHLRTEIFAHLGSKRND